MNKICNACGSNSYKDISLIINQGNRGSVKWLVCNECGSFFSTHVYNEVEEVNHTKNFTSWGNETKGKILNQILKKSSQTDNPSSCKVIRHRVFIWWVFNRNEEFGI